MPTYEGDNTVMAKQAFSLIEKVLKNHKKGVKAQGLLAYLNDIDRLLTLQSDAKTVADVSDLAFLDLALSIRAALSVKQTTSKINASKDKKENQKVIFNDLYAQDIVKMNKLHMMYQTFRHTYDVIVQNNFKDPNVRKVIEINARIFGLNQLITDSHACFETGFFKPGTTALLEEAIDLALRELRPYMVDLVELRGDYEDNSYMSAIGNQYGDCYERQLEWAMSSRLNKKKIPDYYEKHMKPIFHGYKQKL